MERKRSKEEKARDLGIDIRAHSNDYRTPCPSCSPHRKKAKDPCLHVTISSDRIEFMCFHCGDDPNGFRGTLTDDEGRREFTAEEKRAWARRKDAERQRQRQQANRRWW